MALRATNQAIAGLACVGLLALGGCSGEPETVTVTETETVTVPPTPATVTVTVAPEPSAPPEPPLPTGTEKPRGPTILTPESDRRRDLTLSDAFKPDDNWIETLWEFPSTEGELGIGRTIESCYPEDVPPLEFRLNGGFEKFELSAGQSSSSDETHETLKVLIYDNEELLDVKSTVYDDPLKMSVDVQGVTVLKITMHLSEIESDCDYGAVDGVLYSMQLD